MPVILPPGVWEAWLGAENASTEALKAMLVPASAEGMVAYPVNTAVNRGREDAPELIKPV
jgi:putative SOS response-associated peptidase YedK